MKGILRSALEVLVEAMIAYTTAVLGGHWVYERVRFGHFLGWDSDEFAYLGAYGVFAIPALILSIVAVRAIVTHYRLRLWQRAILGVAIGAAMCWSVYSLYTAALLPSGALFIWPLPLIMGGVGGVIIALLRPHLKSETITSTD